MLSVIVNRRQMIIQWCQIKHMGSSYPLRNNHTHNSNSRWYHVIYRKIEALIWWRGIFYWFCCLRSSFYRLLIYYLSFTRYFTLKWVLLWNIFFILSTLYCHIHVNVVSTRYYYLSMPKIVWCELCHLHMRAVLTSHKTQRLFLPRKINVKWYVCWLTRIFNIASDLVAALPPANQKADLKFLVNYRWVWHGHSGTQTFGHIGSCDGLFPVRYQAFC